MLSYVRYGSYIANDGDYMATVPFRSAMSHHAIFMFAFAWFSYVLLSSWTSSSSAACRAAEVKCSGATEGTQQIAVAPQHVAITRENAASSPLLIIPNAGSMSSSPASVLLSAARSFGWGAFDRQRHDGRQFPRGADQPGILSYAGRGERGRNADMSVLNCVRMITEPAMSSPATQRAMTTRRPGIISQPSSRVRRDGHLRPVAIALHGFDSADDGPLALQADGCHEIAQPTVAGLQYQRPVTGGARQRRCIIPRQRRAASPASVARMLSTSAPISGTPTATSRGSCHPAARP